METQGSEAGLLDPGEKVPPVEGSPEGPSFSRVEDSRARAGKAIRALLELGAKEARLVVDDGEVMLPVERVQVGDVIRVRPGEKVPVVGQVLEGGSAVDEAMFTGGARPSTRLLATGSPGDHKHLGRPDNSDLPGGGRHCARSHHQPRRERSNRQNRGATIG